MSNWLLVGHTGNWDVALKAHIWGFTDTYSYAQLARQIAKGDRVFFYVTSPVTGVVGFGKVRGSSFRGDKPLWPSEIRDNQVIYAHRFMFRIMRLLSKEYWKSNHIPVPGRGMAPGRLRGIIQITDFDAKWILEQIEHWRTQRGRVFLSHSHDDNEFCRRLAANLRHKGIYVWMDEAEMQVGDSLIQKISKAIDEMDYVVVVLSKSSVKSRWVRKEVDVAMTREIRGKRVKVLPILLEDCLIPSFLEDKVYADFRDGSKYRKEFGRIVNRVASSRALRA